MPTVCRLLRLPADGGTALIAAPGNLAQSVESARIHSDVYRYWHAIQYLLAQHRPTAPASHWLTLGHELSAGTADIPAARVLLPGEVGPLDSVLREVEPDDLIPHYDADAMDRAGIYPRSWIVWEETFDPLGQVLEHYSFLQSFVRQCADAGDALLLLFEFVDDGSDD